MDYNIDENWLIFMKIDKIGSNRFLWFTENRMVTIQNFQIFEKNVNQKNREINQKKSDKPEKLIGLLFFIQNLNFK
jgi:hypothetical protein